MEALAMTSATATIAAVAFFSGGVTATSRPQSPSSCFRPIVSKGGPVPLGLWMLENREYNGRDA
jgi:hypothetical protein